MTREEAIKIFRGWDGVYIGYSSDEVEEAHDMAIKALSQEPCTDAVSREKAKQFLYERLDRLNDNELYDIFSRIIDAMYNELPSVTPSIDLDKHDEELIKETVANIWGKEPSRRKGHWIDYSDEGYVECPFCGHATTCEDNIDELHYCFYCGAELSGEEQTE